MTTKLSAASLGAIAPSAVIPAYAPSDLSPGILHFGVGNFHRSHQAVYLDALFNMGEGQDWAIVGAGVMDGDKDIRERLKAQDYLTTVIAQDADRSEARVTAAMIDYIVPGDTQAIIAQLADPAIRIVSMTITEGGYCINPASGTFDPTYPAIAADAAAPDRPKTVFGLIVAGLKLRREAGVPAFTVMSCDNLPHNGAIAKSVAVGLAALSDKGLAAWIEENVAFPNGMVDRITPATGDREREILARDFGIEDTCPVFCEGFKQWVLEDNFPTGRPALEKVGVQFVPDVAPYEHMKIRILNGGHAVIAYPAGLMGIHFVHEAMENPLVRGFLEKVEREEIIPVVPPVPDTDLDEYYKLIETRFANPKIGDTVHRLCFDGSNRQPQFIIPGIKDRLENGGGISGLALESALWCRYCFGVTDSGAEIAPNDPNWDRLSKKAREAKADPANWLAMDDIYGDVGRSEVFKNAFAGWLSALWANGTESVLKAYLEDGT
ncbi:mannitol dehydrogenase family protein [Rhizobiales bacterium]|uniref:mannitol dehydrogenase family protein n=1 Tax=Hongsoonwoonella zoysiae TaxID=2821844 RepID=UPI001560BFE5|nr:mannitol dehydrogenase family protein [Hongsoonwoonella zoysiae]NRG16267.1 mannitol dehydrogenase family protein [Hongsoonwoonella zoysiae]